MDGYCERAGDGLWAEPLNAISNAAFLIAAAVLLWRARRPDALPVILAVVGLCSLSFHTFANAPTAALDSLSILAFILVAVVLLVHHGFGVRPARAWLAAPAFVLFFAAVNALLALAGRQYTLGGYLPDLLGLVGFAVALRSRTLGRAAAVFSVSLMLRTLDEPLCDAFPAGLHWGWHCLNAVVLFLVSIDVVRLRGTIESSSDK